MVRASTSRSRTKDGADGTAVGLRLELQERVGDLCGERPAIALEPSALGPGKVAEELVELQNAVRLAATSSARGRG